MFKKIRELRVRFAMDTKSRMMLYGAAVMLNILNLWVISQRDPSYLAGVVALFVIPATIMIYVVTGGIRAFLAPIGKIAEVSGGILSVCSVMMGPACILVIPFTFLVSWGIAPLILLLGTYYCPAILVPVVSHYYRKQIMESRAFEMGTL